MTITTTEIEKETEIYYLRSIEKTLKEYRNVKAGYSWFNYGLSDEIINDNLNWLQYYIEKIENDSNKHSDL